MVVAAEARRCSIPTAAAVRAADRFDWPGRLKRSMFILLLLLSELLKADDSLSDGNDEVAVVAAAVLCAEEQMTAGTEWL